MSRRPMSRSVSATLAGSRTPIRHAAGLALQPSPSPSLAAQESEAGIFRELDALVGLGTERQQERARTLEAELTRMLNGALQCHEVAAALLSVDDLDDEGRGGQLNGRQLFAELDGLSRPLDPVVERVAATRLEPFKKELEALLQKVATESRVLRARHPEAPGQADGRAERQPRAGTPEAMRAAPEAPATMRAAPGTRPVCDFAELEALLAAAPVQHQEHGASLVARLTRCVDGAARSKERASSAAERALLGDDVREDWAHEAWRRGALDALKGESPAARRSLSQAVLSSSCAKPAFSRRCHAQRPAGGVPRRLPPTSTPGADQAAAR